MKLFQQRRLISGFLLLQAFYLHPGRQKTKKTFNQIDSISQEKQREKERGRELVLSFRQFQDQTSWLFLTHGRSSWTSACLRHPKKTIDLTWNGQLLRGKLCTELSQHLSVTTCREVSNVWAIARDRFKCYTYPIKLQLLIELKTWRVLTMFHSPRYTWAKCPEPIFCLRWTVCLSTRKYSLSARWEYKSSAEQGGWTNGCEYMSSDVAKSYRTKKDRQSYFQRYQWHCSTIQDKAFVHQDQSETNTGPVSKLFRKRIYFPPRKHHLSRGALPVTLHGAFNWHVWFLQREQWDERSRKLHIYASGIHISQLTRRW